MRMGHIVICGLPTILYFSTLPHKWRVFRKKKIIEPEVSVSSFSTNLSKTFFILRRNDRGVIKMFIGYHVNYPLLLSDLNET